MANLPPGWLETIQAAQQENRPMTAEELRRLGVTLPSPGDIAVVQEMGTASMRPEEVGTPEAFAAGGGVTTTTPGVSVTEVDPRNVGTPEAFARARPGELTVTGPGETLTRELTPEEMAQAGVLSEEQKQQQLAGEDEVDTSLTELQQGPGPTPPGAPTPQEAALGAGTRRAVSMSASGIPKGGTAELEQGIDDLQKTRDLLAAVPEQYRGALERQFQAQQEALGIKADAVGQVQQELEVQAQEQQIRNQAQAETLQEYVEPLRQAEQEYEAALQQQPVNKWAVMGGQALNQIGQMIAMTAGMRAAPFTGGNLAVPVVQMMSKNFSDTINRNVKLHEQMLRQKRGQVALRGSALNRLRQIYQDDNAALEKFHELNWRAVKTELDKAQLQAASEEARGALGVLQAEADQKILESQARTEDAIAGRAAQLAQARLQRRQIRMADAARQEAAQAPLQEAQTLLESFGGYLETRAGGSTGLARFGVAMGNKKVADRVRETVSDAAIFSQAIDEMQSMMSNLEDWDNIETKQRMRVISADLEPIIRRKTQSGAALNAVEAATNEILKGGDPTAIFARYSIKRAKLDEALKQYQKGVDKTLRSHGDLKINWDRARNLAAREPGSEEAAEALRGAR